MREIDKRTRVSRRVFLRSTATVVPAAAALAAGVAISAQAAWAQDAKALKPHTLATLVRVARDTYPHDRLADLYYVKAVTPYDAKAGGDAAFHAMIESGVARLDADAQDRHGANYIDLAWEEQRVSILRANEHTPFFKKVRSDLVVTLYNQKEVWPKFGYEGSSADKGGYIHRGFNDIDWLSSV
jgi:hypothetical protein